ncbi:MAG: hypothetical protein AB7I33_02000 [Gemmatimonadales bacterium]
MSEVTLGGYRRQHDRAPAFGGSDGHPYSVGIHLSDDPDARGLYGAALLFIRWSAAGDRPVGHLETDWLAWGRTPAEASERIELLSLFDVKAALEEAIANAPPADW